MKRSLLAFACALCAAVPAVAQDESQQDIAERIVREQEEKRERALAKVMTAPDYAAKATSRDVGAGILPPSLLPDRDPETGAFVTPSGPAKPAVPSGGLPLPLIACLIPVVPMIALIWISVRKRSLEKR